MLDIPDSVSTLFARAAAALTASPAAARVTVTTADLATALGPWSLAWAAVDWAGGHRLLVLRHVEPGWEAGVPWADAPAEGRLAALRQLPELIRRAAEAAAQAEVDASAEAIGGLGVRIEGAIEALVRAGGGGPGGPAGAGKGKGVS